MTALLAPVRRLDVWLFVVLVVLVVTSAVRYVLRHGLGTVRRPDPPRCGRARRGLRGASVATRAVVVPAAWSVTLAALVAALTVVAPSFAWCAVPVAFAVLGTLPFRWAVACVTVLMIVITASWLRISSAFDPALVAGPLGIALITVMAFRALDLESKARAKLIDRLVATQDDLAAEQRRAGALRERARLSRDIHDSVGQDLSSVYLLLQAADRSWETQPRDAHDNVRTAIDASRRGLEEIRHVIHDLSTEVESSTLTSPAELHRRLDDVGERSHGPAAVALRVDGTAVPLSHRLVSANVATARGALANAQEHAGADRVMMTLTYTDDEVRLDVRDDGRGFDVDRALAARSGSTRPSGRSPRGLGLKGINDRVVDLGGGVAVESETGDGTTVSVWFPIGVHNEEQ